MSRLYANILSGNELQIPEGWLQIETIDMHTGGEPLRVIRNGFPELKGNNVLERRRDCMENYDHLRKLLMFEPRGHADMYGCILCPPNDKEGDFGVIFLHNEGYSTMCGHAIIALATLALEMDWVERSEGEIEIKIDAPCGRIRAFTSIVKGEIVGTRFHCVPSFAVGLDKKVFVEGIGEINYDLAYGGAFYTYVDLRKNNLNLELNIQNYGKLIETGMAIKHAVIAADSMIKHPFEEELSFLYGCIFIGEAHQPAHHSRNVCIFAEGEVDRCPTGSGVSGRIALHHARGELTYGQSLSIESITDSVFTGSLAGELDFGPYKAVIPEVSGSAWITGTHRFLLDPKDPVRQGFILR